MSDLLKDNPPERQMPFFPPLGKGAKKGFSLRKCYGRSKPLPYGASGATPTENINSDRFTTQASTSLKGGGFAEGEDGGIHYTSLPLSGEVAKIFDFCRRGSKPISDFFFSLPLSLRDISL